MNDKDDAVEAYGADDEGNFIRNMQKLREQNGWTQGELARRMQDAGWTSFHQTTVSRIEKGERPVRLGEARGIAKVLGTITSQMILPDEEFMKLRTLELQIIQVKNAKDNLFHAFSKLEAELGKLRMDLDEVLEQDPADDMDAPIATRREITISIAEDELRKSLNDRFNEYMEQTHDVIIAGDPDGVDPETA